MARENKSGNPLDQQICDIHRQYLKVFEEQRLDSISDSTKESYLAVLRSLTAKLEVPSKPLSEIVSEMMAEAAPLIFKTMQS